LKVFSLHKHLPGRTLLYFAAGLFLLSIFSSLNFSVEPGVKFHQKRLQKFLNDQQYEVNALFDDTLLMRKLVLKNESLPEFQQISDKKFGFFLFAETISDQQNLLFWNKQEIIPPQPSFSTPDSVYFRQMPNGYFVIIQRTLVLPGMSNKVVGYGLIPVLNKYYLETDYLVTSFSHDKEASQKVVLSAEATAFPVFSLNDQPLFHLEKVAFSNLGTSSTLGLILRMGALLFLLLYLHLWAEKIARIHRVLYGIIFFFLVLLVFRIMIYSFPGIFSFRQFELFDPLIYASNAVNRSLGDLLINILLLCWLVLFSWQNIGPQRRIPVYLEGKWKYLAGALAIGLLILVSFLSADLVRGLVTNSKISFNVNDFFSLDEYTIVGFIVLALLALTYYYITRLILRLVFTAYRDQPLVVYFMIALLGLIFLTFRSGDDIILFHLPVLFWLIVYTFLISQEGLIVNRFNASIAGILFWIFIFSISLSAIILQGNRENELRTRKGMAEKYDQLTDPSSEPTINIAIAYLNNRFFLSNFDRFRREPLNRQLRDSITTSFFSGYSNRYDTRLYVFDSTNSAINNDDASLYAELNTIYTVQSRNTNIPDMHFHETRFDHFTYITRRIIRDTTDFLGTVFIISTPRKYGTTDALYPELFRQMNKNDPGNSPLYSFAIYNDRLLIDASSKYPFQISLTKEQLPVNEFEQRTYNGYDELWYKASTKKVVIIARKQDSLLESITLFSYLFCAFLIMVGFLQMMALVVRLAGDPSATGIFSQLNIRSQIHGTIIFISVLSFLIIGAATISFFILRYNRNNIDKLSRTAGIMVKEMYKPLTMSPDPEGARNDSLTLPDLEQLVNEVADIHNVDVNIYDLNGNLEVTSDEDVYKKGILSYKMHPLAFYHLNRMRQVQRVQEENVSSLNYLSIYSAVRDKNGVVRKYLNIPYFSSQIDLRQEISNFLVTIINLNAFIFLIAGIIALFITNKITRSFSVIGEKMRDITLGRTNEEIVWEKNDEIGELVTQYNKMVHELEKSAMALAKSEREGAWREMARQVAHEIKNPLTPMKLSIQYLQKAIHSNQHPNIRELTTNVANTLIEQIDHLSKIAADFSQFANIGIKKLELVDLHLVLGSLVDLYNTNPRVEIHWDKLDGSIILKADKTHMNRLFTNLMANAVDACAGREVCRILISEERKEGHVIIMIRDNGEGIPADIQQNIFTPNFTTKTSGTGLGLAMSKSIVEQSQGEIWFTTEEGNGTCFYVKLPVVE
jgi:two-component system, NtrC family, nitrogen regulation sensor histidine kinase NtrY